MWESVTLFLLSASRFSAPIRSESSHLVAWYSKSCRLRVASLLSSTAAQVELHAVAAFRWYRKYRNPDRSAQDHKKTVKKKWQSGDFFSSLVPSAGLPFGKVAELLRGRREREPHQHLMEKVVTLIIWLSAYQKKSTSNELIQTCSLCLMHIFLLKHSLVWSIYLKYRWNVKCPLTLFDHIIYLTMVPTKNI